MQEHKNDSGRSVLFLEIDDQEAFLITNNTSPAMY